MIRATRRRVLAGSVAAGVAGTLAVPASARIGGVAEAVAGRSGRALLLHDPALAAGRRFAAAGAGAGGAALAIEGDRIRFARAALETGPALVAGVSRHADALLIADVAREAGYEQVAELRGDGAALVTQRCRDGWHGLARLAGAAADAWVEALAIYAATAGESAADFHPAPVRGSARPGGRDTVLGWVLAPRA